MYYRRPYTLRRINAADMSTMVDEDYDGASSSADALETLERWEQDVINHLRTAGLPKASEIKLVDEILKIRKGRRQVFSAMQTKIAKINGRVGDAEEELRSRKKQLIVERDDFVFREKEMKISYTERLKEQEAYLKRKFEDKLKQLNGKYEDYLEGKEKEHIKALDSARQESTAREVQEVTRRHDDENLRLVKTLREAMGQNETLKQVARQKGDAAEKLRHECLGVHSKLEEEKNRRAAIEKKLSGAIAHIEGLQSKLDSEVNYARDLSTQLERQQEERSVATESSDRSHAEEMTLVEKKVKQALAAKDVKISQLMGRCSALEQELQGLSSFVR